MRKFRLPITYFIGFALILVVISACGTAATPSSHEVIMETQIVEAPAEEPAVSTSIPVVEQTVEVVKTVEVEKTVEVVETPQPRPTAPAIEPTEMQVVEERVVELEWPPRLRYGESDTLRLSLVPYKEGYIVRSEFGEHQVQSQEVEIVRIEGYELWAIAQLDGVGFVISPQGKQEQWVPVDQPITYRWSLTGRQPGQHRVAVSLWFHWKAIDSRHEDLGQYSVFSKSLSILVDAFLGMKQSQAIAFGVTGLIFGSAFSLAAVVIHPTRARKLLREVLPNPALQIELGGQFELSGSERSLLSSLFERYERVILEKEFLSGYSGARTFLALPIRSDGGSDAYTIAKIGDVESIEREFSNYETFVKDTLPPLTARIQHIPVIVQANNHRDAEGIINRLAALQYTFIGEQGILPTSFYQALQQEARPELIFKLFETFGPNWWMQHRPYTFTLAREYDCLLPTHLVLEPCSGSGRVIGANTTPNDLHAEIGEILTLHGFHLAERRPARNSLSYENHPQPGLPPVRIRWLNLQASRRLTGKVVATRETLLRNFTRGFDLCGLPDPLLRITELLKKTIIGAQSTIHGDLNLQNILLGPGDLVWLIDFAQTRTGPPLLDFAHLEAELVAHVFSKQTNSPNEYLAFLAGNPPTSLASCSGLYSALQEIASRCLANTSRRTEWDLALTMALLGALKYGSLDDHSRHFLYLTAAYIAQQIQ